MLTDLSLVNFKAFQNLNGMKLKPITIICGANSCGKSSIMQSLLLLKQTFESKSTTNTVLMNGKYVRLGNVENVIFSHSLQKKLALSVTFNVSHNRLGKFRIENRAPLSYLLRDVVPPSGEGRLLGYKVTIEIEVSPALKRRRTLITRPTNVDRFEVTITPDYGEDAFPPPTRLRFIKLSKHEYEISYERARNRIASTSDRNQFISGSMNGTVRFINLLPQIVQLKDRPDQSAPFLIPRVNLILQALFGSFSYIGPLREEPARRYIYEDEVMEVGTKGENAPYILLAQRDAVVSDTVHFDYDENVFRRVERETLGAALDRWLKAMKVQGFQVESSKEMIHVSMKTNSSDRTEVSIADVGFGVSQVFPILLEGLRMDRGATLFLEQPEIHLHPRLQMYLADYLIGLAISGKGAVVETHSDHLINRLVRRIVEDHDHNIANLIQIYFVRGGDDGSIIEDVRIDPLQGIVNWPDEFFDQAASELEATIRAGINKRAGMTKR